MDASASPERMSASIAGNHVLRSKNKVLMRGKETGRCGGIGRSSSDRRVGKNMITVSTLGKNSIIWDISSNLNEQAVKRKRWRVFLNPEKHLNIISRCTGPR